VPSFQFGINTDLTYNCQDADTFHRWAQTQFSQDKSLGANSIGIVFPLYTDSIHSNVVAPRSVCNDSRSQSPPPEILGDVADVAHSLGLKVFFRPYIDSTNLESQNPNYWAGVLQPTSVSQWFYNYLSALTPYLVVAQQHSVEHFAMASELNSLAHSRLWTAFIRGAKSVYQGDLVYSFSFNNPDGKVVMPGASIGIDAYPAVTSARVADQYTVWSASKILQHWNALYRQNPKYRFRQLSSATFDEVGIAAVLGAYQTPWTSFSVTRRNAFDQRVQANWFTAACSFAKQHSMHGIYFWGPWLGNRGGALLSVPTPSSPMDLQPAAQRAIKRCFTS
jgi:hypothetical protein